MQEHFDIGKGLGMRHLREDATHVGIRFQAVGADGFNQAVERGAGQERRSGGITEQPGFATDLATCRRSDFMRDFGKIVLY